MDYEIGKLYNIQLIKSAQEFYTFYRTEGWYGLVWQQDNEHIYIKSFGTTIDGSIYFGSDTRIRRCDIDVVCEYDIKELAWRNLLGEGYRNERIEGYQRKTK